MPYNHVILDTAFIETVLSTLSAQSSLKGFVEIHTVTLNCSVCIKKESDIFPTLIIDENGGNITKGDIASISLYYTNLNIKFKASIVDICSQIYVLSKPESVTISQHRRSERYRVDSAKDIILSMSLCSYKVIDICSNGIAIHTSNSISAPGTLVRDCLLKTEKKEFVVDCIFKSCSKTTHNQWKYGIELTFKNTEDFLTYLEWLFHMTNPEVYTQATITTNQLLEYFENSTATLLTKNNHRKAAIIHHLKSWDISQDSQTLFCTVAVVKNKNLVSACYTHQIYKNTFFSKRLICIPGYHLHESPKLLVYTYVSDILFNHPSCNYLLFYIDRDREWHEELCRRLQKYAHNEHFIYQKLGFIDVLLSDNLKTHTTFIADQTCQEPEPSYEMTPLRCIAQFKTFIKNQCHELLYKAYDYAEFNGLDSTSHGETGTQFLNRKIFVISDQGTHIGYAVCEVVSNPSVSDTTLDLCRLYLANNVSISKVLISSLISNIGEYYTLYNKNQFRIAWGLANQPVEPLSSPDIRYTGEMLQLILAKDGILSLRQVCLISDTLFSRLSHLSYPQQGIWHYEQIYPHTTIATISCTAHIAGNINFHLLEKAINTVIQAHDGLRLQLTLVNNQPYQYIEPYKMRVIPLVDFSRKENELSFKDFETAFSKQTLELYDSPLVKFQMFSNGDSKGFFFKIHHIISDSWCVSILCNRILEYYTNYKNNHSDQTSIGPSYREYLTNEYNYIYSNKFIENKQFWLNCFETLPDSIDFIRSSTDSAASKRESFILDKQFVHDIIQFTKMNDCSVFSFLFSSFFIYIHKLYSVNTISIGTTILNRSTAREKLTPGLFVNTVPVKMIVDDTLPLKTFINQFSHLMRKILKHQKFSYELLLQDIQKKHPERNKLFEMTFSYFNSKFCENTLIDSFEWHPHHYQSEILNIHVNDWERKGILAIGYDYHISTFSQDDIQRMHRHFMYLIKNLIMNPDISLHKTSVLSKKESFKLLTLFNHSKAFYPKELTIHKAFEEQVQKNPGKTAVIDNNSSFSYDYLNKSSNRLANYLIGLTKESTENLICIFIQNSMHQIVAQLGVLKSGNAYIPLETSTPLLRIKSILTDAHAKIIIATSSHRDTLLPLMTESNLDLKLIIIDEYKKNISLTLYELKSNSKISSRYNNDYLDDNPDISVHSSQLAYVIFTSGSTGSPKGVMIEHRSVINQCYWFKKYHHINEMDTIARYIAFSFDGSVTEVVTSLITGASLNIIPNTIRNDPRLVSEYINHHAITFCIFPTLFYEKFQNFNCPSVRMIITGGDKLTSYRKNTYTVINGYGPTEYTVFTTAFIVDKNYHRFPIGKPVANTQIYILDSNNSLLPIGVPGELCISGDGLARGYINIVDSDKFIPNPFIPGTRMYKTGDIARWLPDGNIEYIGRKDDQIKLRGFRIELKEIESVLLKHAKISTVAVVLKTNANEDKHICAYYEAEQDVASESLADHVAKYLPHYMVPSFFVHLEKLPLLSSGKINRISLQHYKDDENLIPKKEYYAPTNETEKSICDIIGRELHISPISITDNFFKIGGNSLSAISVVSQISTKFNIPLTVNTLFENPTPLRLAQCVNAALKNESCSNQSVASEEIGNQKISFMHTTKEPLSDMFKKAELGRVDAAALGYLPTSLPEQTHLSRTHIINNWLNNSPMWHSILETTLGKTSIILIPLFEDELYGNKQKLMNALIEGIQFAAEIGAKAISLTGLIPSATNYGHDITEYLKDQHTIPMLTTGHATTCASIVLNVEKIVQSAHMNIENQTVAFIGLGSVGLSTLHLLLKISQHPKEILLCDLYTKEAYLHDIKKELVTQFQFKGDITVIPTEPGKKIPSLVYNARVFICATNVSNILDITKINPGSILIDDSAPHCFDSTEGIARLKKENDILFTEGGFLHSPAPINQVFYKPPFIDRNVFSYNPHPFNITGCVTSSLLSVRFPELRPTTGLVHVNESIQHYLKLKDLGFNGAELHCLDLNTNVQYYIPKDTIKQFQKNNR